MSWIPCVCGEWFCTIHSTHTYECECPPIEEWQADPYMITKSERSAAAALLGKLGGQARNKSVSQADKVRIAKMGGRPSRYRMVRGKFLERLTHGAWVALDPPYDAAARAYLYREKKSSE